MMLHVLRLRASPQDLQEVSSPAGQHAAFDSFKAGGMVDEVSLESQFQAQFLEKPAVERN